jgi:hypothetical protein
MWLWWSVSVPKWRIWAMERTDNWPSLERAAIERSLIWDDSTWYGRMFSKTEIWSAADREHAADLLEKRKRKNQATG